MGEHDQEEIRRQIEELFAYREGLRRDLIRASLRDPKLWGEQVLALILGAARAVAAWLALRVLLTLWPLYQGWPIAEIEGYLSLFALGVLPILLVWNPRGVFLRNVFAKQVDAALETYFKK
jgi:hypothetical protein